MIRSSILPRKGVFVFVALLLSRLLGGLFFICSVISCSDSLEQYRKWATEESDRKISFNLNGQDYSRTFSNDETCVVHYTWNEKYGCSFGELWFYFGILRRKQGISIPSDEENDLTFDFRFESETPFPVNEYFDFDNDNAIYFYFVHGMRQEEDRVKGHMRIKEINKMKKKVQLEFEFDYYHRGIFYQVREGLLDASLELEGKAKELFY